ncbi:MAG: hypothetical protein ABI846_13755 [Rudaea sp.]
MNQNPLSATFSLRGQSLPDADPPADLWARIAHAHGVRLVRRRRQRLAGIAFVAVAACATTIGYFQLHAMTSTKPSAVDWQARADALELQLYAMQRDNQFGNAGSHGLESELGTIDQSLQTAYESGAPASVLIPLWKRRSELLDTLIVARKQNLILTRI